MRRRRELLSVPQRAQLYGVVVGRGERELARHYTLSAADRVLIGARWPEVLHLAASIKMGVATASLLLGKLGAYSPTGTGLAWPCANWGDRSAPTTTSLTAPPG